MADGEEEAYKTYSKAAEYIVMHEPSISPEFVGGMLADATQSVPSFLKGEQRQNVLSEIAAARRWFREELAAIGAAPAGEYRFKIADRSVGEVHESASLYPTRLEAELAMIDYVKAELRPIYKEPTLDFELVRSPSGEVERVVKSGVIGFSGKILAASEYGAGGAL